MVAGPTGLSGNATAETGSREVKCVHKRIDHPNWMILANPVLQTIREKGRLVPVHSLDIARHPHLQLMKAVSLNLEFSNSLGRKMPQG